MVGWSKEELIGRTSSYLYWAPEHLQAIEEAFQLTIANKAPKEGFELVFIRRDGTLFPAQVIISPYRDGKQISGWLANVTDITERKQSEDSLLQTRCERFWHWYSGAV